MGARMLPLYAARIEDLGQGDFVKVDCAACRHVALLSPEFLLRRGLSLQTKVLDLKERVRCRGCGKRGRAVVFDQVGAGEQVSRPLLPAPVKPSRRRRSLAHPTRWHQVGPRGGGCPALATNPSNHGAGAATAPGPHRSSGVRAPAFASTNVSLAKLAAEVGYDSESSFARAFRRRFGVSPGRSRSSSSGD